MPHSNRIAQEVAELYRIGAGDGQQLVPSGPVAGTLVFTSFDRGARLEEVFPRLPPDACDQAEWVLERLRTATLPRGCWPAVLYPGNPRAGLRALYEAFCRETGRRPYTPSPHPRGEPEPTHVVRDKREMYALYGRGAFGNKPRNWYSIEELLSSGFPGKVAIRHQVPQSPWMRFHVEPGDVAGIVDRWVAAGARRDYFEFSEMLPEHRRLLCGDIERREDGLTLWVALGPGGTYREAMGSRAQEFRGLRAQTLLKQTLWPSDWEDLQVLWDQYPECVVEISAYEVGVGVLPNRRSVVWECRAY